MREATGLHPLILRIASGDPRAQVEFDALAREPLRRFVTGHYGSAFSKEDVQEIVDQTIFTVFVHAGEYRGERGEPSAWQWAYQIARNQAHKWHKVYLRIVPFPDLEARNESGAEVDFTLAALRFDPDFGIETVEDEVLEHIFRQQLVAFVCTLSRRERLILHLYCNQDWSFKQIAAYLKVKPPRICQILQAIQGKCRGAVGWNSP